MLLSHSVQYFDTCVTQCPLPGALQSCNLVGMTPRESTVSLLSNFVLSHPETKSPKPKPLRPDMAPTVVPVPDLAAAMADRGTELGKAGPHLGKPEDLVSRHL